ncbi:ANTAR domain-containing protein [Sinomonas sp. B1-1]|uniref:ANTAR domain-containing protein n=1 Tax=Sinomonas sp. B1-1 TaxID=3141454 RepID=UPI003D2C51E3
MAARPQNDDATHDLMHLLLACSSLTAFLPALAERTHRRLASLGTHDCALILRRRNRPAITGASSEALAAVVEERLSDDDQRLAAALERSQLTMEPRLPASWTSGMAWGVDAGLLVVPAPAGSSAAAALAVVGTDPVDDDARRTLLAAVGRVRNQASWALQLAVRLSDWNELAEHRAQAMQNRTVIDVAIGVIMAQSRCSAAEAFDVLRRASNNRNVKLHTVAAELVQRIHPALPETAFSE